MKQNKLTQGSNMRWESSMMLPEHVQALNDLHVDLERVKKPQLDEQGWEQINETIHYAMEFNLPVTFTLWIDGLFLKLDGFVHFINQMNKLVHVVDISEKVHKIKFDAIAEVEFAK